MELIPTVTVIHTLTVAPIPTVTATLLNLTATVDKLTAIQLIPVSVKPSLSNHSWNFIVFKFVRWSVHRLQDRILLLTLANILTLVHTLEPIHPVARTRQLDLIPQVILAVDHTLRVVPTLVVSAVLDRVRKR